MVAGADPVRPGMLAALGARPPPAAGVRLYSKDGPIAGPSDSKGWIEVPDAPIGGIWTAWAPGWAAQRVGSRPPFPDEVLLEPAAAGLRVSVRSSDPAAQIVRTRLVAIGRPGTPEEPWAPRLEIQRPLGAGSGQLPPGPYDVYVWITRDNAAPRILPRQRVELEQGRTLDLDLDADALTATEPDG